MSSNEFIYIVSGEAMYGTLGVATRGGEMTGFREYLESVSLVIC